MHQHPPAPLNIAQHGSSDKIGPLVSVLCVAYNHAHFIEKCLDGFLLQETTFPVEIIVHDDSSTDRTADLVRSYAARYPRLIRTVFQEKNQFTQGINPVILMSRMAHGAFLALCEGDDYWTDPEKLQRQVEYLQANPDCIGCFHDAKVVDSEGHILLDSYFQSDQDKFTQRDVLESLISREPTCSLLFRKQALAESLPDSYLNHPCDLYLDILLTSRGSLGFVRRNMGAYRKHSGGAWSSQREASQIIELISRYNFLLADKILAEKHKDILLRKIEEFKGLLFTRADAGGEIVRLERIVQEQTNAIKAMLIESDRLSMEAAAARAQAKQAALDGQKHIDDLKAQLDQLAATSAKQSAHIAILEKERDRLTAETAATKTQAKQAIIDSQKHIDSLTAQLDLSAREHQQTINGLKTQLDRTVADSQKVIDDLKEQLEHSAREHQKTIDPLMAQLDQLAATSMEQARYIDILSTERDKLKRLVALPALEAMKYRHRADLARARPGRG